MFTHSIFLIILSVFHSLCLAGPISVLPSSNVPGYVPPAPTAPVVVPSSPTVPVSVPLVSAPASVPLSSAAHVYVPPVPTPPVYSPLASTPPVYSPAVPTASVYQPLASTVAIPTSVASSSTVSHWEPPVPTVNCHNQTCNSRLWNATGPDILDVRQVHQNDCWWKAVQVSVTHHAKNRIMNFFFHPITKHSYADQTGDALFAPNPMVQLYNPFTYLPEYFDADIKERDLYDDKGPILGVFWPDAMTQAMRKLMDRYGLQGYNRTTKQLDEGPEEYGPRIDMALSILTGKPGWVNKFSDYGSSDALYAYFEQSIYTPMMFTSVPLENLTVTDPAMKEDHVYPIISTYYNTTTNAQMIHTRNVWGRTDNFTMADVWRNGLNFIHLQHYDRLT